MKVEKYGVKHKKVNTFFSDSIDAISFWGSFAELSGMIRV